MLRRVQSELFYGMNRAVRLTLSGLAAASLLACAAGRDGGGVTMRAPGRSFDSTAQAIAAFDEITTRYATCRTYRDRGEVVVTSWSGSEEKPSSVGRFDTIFVRDRGLRFRYFAESGELRYGFWAVGDAITELAWGSVTHFQKLPLVDAMFSLKGVTSLASWVVPNLLYGRLKPHSAASPGPENNAACNKCPSVTFYQAVEDQTMTFNLDLGVDVVRRFRLLVAKPATDAMKRAAEIGTDDLPNADALTRTETRIFYDSPQLNVDESALRAELEAQPW
jgi:hypothetical protein